MNMIAMLALGAFRGVRLQVQTVAALGLFVQARRERRVSVEDQWV